MTRSATNDYPNAAATLIGTHELAAALCGDAVHVLDCRLDRDYAQEHIPGARWIDIRALRKGATATTLPTSNDLAERLRRAGIGSDRPIAIYADRLTYTLAAYAWWLLRYVGHPDVRVVHGGWEAWVREGREMQVTAPALTGLPPFIVQPRDAWLTDTAAVESARCDARVQLVDARSAKEHAAGTIESIAGTRQLSHDAVFDPETCALQPPQTLAALFAVVDPHTPLVAYCQSGARSATLLWALHAMGYNRLTNYHGSMQDWQAQGRPVATR